MERRNKAIDLAKGILILLVTIGHTIQGFTTGGRYGDFFLNRLFAFIYSFHMPAFMLISGYLFYFSLEKRGSREAVLNKVFTLLIPIITWNVAGYLLFYLPENLSVLVSPKMFIRSLLSYATLWFLGSVFLNSLILIGGKALKGIRRNGAADQGHTKAQAASGPGALWKDIVALGIVIVFSMLIPAGAQYVFMFPYFLGGYDLAKHKRRLIPEKPGIFSVCCCFIFFFLFLFYGKEDYIYTTGIFVLRRQKQVITDLYRWLIGVAGTVFFVTAVSWLAKLPCKKAEKIFCGFGQNTLVIYAIQNFVVFKIAGACGKAFSAGIPILRNEIAVSMVCIVLGVILTMAMNLLAKMFRKNPVTDRFLCGGWRF